MTFVSLHEYMYIVCIYVSNVMNIMKHNGCTNLSVWVIKLATIENNDMSIFQIFVSFIKMCVVVCV